MRKIKGKVQARSAVSGRRGGQARVYTAVKKDPLDLRDIMYEGSLKELPLSIDNRGSVPFVMDQGKEGACTGFGLAAVVN